MSTKRKRKPAARKPQQKKKAVSQDANGKPKPEGTQTERVQDGLRLNLGCGRNIQEGFINVDKFGDPDMRMDLEHGPWPWPDNSVSEVWAVHVLEHLGETLEKYFGFWKELYRVMHHGAVISIVVPHPRCDDFINDPTHIRPVTPETIGLFDQDHNQQWIEAGAANSVHGLDQGVFFKELPHMRGYVMTPAFAAKYQGADEESKQLAFNNEMSMLWNVCKEIRMVFAAIKDQEDQP